jgi:pyruvate,orthophosphate dikinase
VKREKRVKLDTDLDAENMKDFVERYLEVYKRAAKSSLRIPWKQLWMAIDAVIGSLDERESNKVPALNGVKEGELLGTAVNIVQMVFGNTGEDRGTGVAFTRDPNTGEKQFNGEYLQRSRRTFVAGTRTPFPNKTSRYNPEVMTAPEKFTKLENHYRDMQEIEFTVDTNSLSASDQKWERTPYASVKIAVDTGRSREGFQRKKRS